MVVVEKREKLPLMKTEEMVLPLLKIEGRLPLLKKEGKLPLVKMGNLPLVKRIVKDRRKLMALEENRTV